jgi:hypothetical protein
MWDDDWHSVGPPTGEVAYVVEWNSKPAPEPGTLALLAAGAFGLVGYVWQRRMAARRTAKPAAFDQ